MFSNPGANQSDGGLGVGHDMVQGLNADAELDTNPVMANSCIVHLWTFPTLRRNML